LLLCEIGGAGLPPFPLFNKICSTTVEKKASGIGEFCHMPE